MKALVNDPNRVDLRFGQDADGELYVLAKANGKIWKVTGARTFASCRSGHDFVAGCHLRAFVAAGDARVVAVPRP